uniref:Uncharacterized protein n=1 Tax=Spironucleus salmonicida TaxID=348837 RepID=V6LIE6_9EUKA|eukprot:EST44088.1 Hypothetical protein SS50377_16159 [Spironucleus salmonicida]
MAKWAVVHLVPTRGENSPGLPLPLPFPDVRRSSSGGWQYRPVSPGVARTCLGGVRWREITLDGLPPHTSPCCHPTTHRTPKAMTQPKYIRHIPQLHIIIHTSIHTAWQIISLIPSYARRIIHFPYIQSSPNQKYEYYIKYIQLSSKNIIILLNIQHNNAIKQKYSCYSSGCNLIMVSILI